MTKSPLQTFLIQRLAGRLLPAVPSGWFIRKEEPLTLADSEPEPDLAIAPPSPEGLFSWSQDERPTVQG